MRSLFLFCLLFAFQPTVQDLSPWADPAKVPILVNGKITRYDPFQLENADLILRTPQGKFVRLLYSPFNWGFDAPRAKPEQMIPMEMIFNGKLDWQFRTHLPRTEQEKLLCSQTLKTAHREPDGKYVDTERPYEIVRGSEVGEPPPTLSLQCLIVEQWTNSKTGKIGPSK